MSVGRANINSIYLNCTLKTLFACIIKVEENLRIEDCLITYSVDMLMYYHPPLLVLFLRKCLPRDHLQIVWKEMVKKAMNKGDLCVKM